MQTFGRKGRERLSTGDLGEIKRKVVVVVVERERTKGLIEGTECVIISRLVHCRFFGTTTAIIVSLARNNRRSVTCTFPSAKRSRSPYCLLLREGRRADMGQEYSTELKEI